MDAIAQEIVQEINNIPVSNESKILELVQKSLIPQAVVIPQPDEVFGINGIPLFTKKSISTLIGRAKGGKTVVTSWVVSELLKKDSRAIWIDTEQGLYYGSRTQYWILNMAGMSTTENLKYYDLKIHTPPVRIEIIEYLIKELSPDLVIIDGVRDLVFDINNPEQTTIIVGNLMRWAEEYDCHILNIIHQNKGNDHARGHLGTEMINKSETVVKVEKNKDDLYVASPEYTRNKEFEAFAFERDSNGIPQLVKGFSGEIETESNGTKGGRKAIDPTDPKYNPMWIAMVDYIFKDPNQHFKYGFMISSIQEYMDSIGSGVGEVTAKRFFTRLIHVGILWENPYIKGHAKYGRNPKFDPVSLIQYDPVKAQELKAEMDEDAAPF